MPVRLAHDQFSSPIGAVHIVTNQSALVAVDFGGPEERLLPLLEKRFGAEFELTTEVDPLGGTSALKSYFEGDFSAFDDLPLDGGGTAFQKKVWSALMEIPVGETWSYGQLAQHLGDTNASRAVGLANGRNPIGIIVPCHRVIGANGDLTGYGGGIDRKSWLLAHEDALPQQQDDLFAAS